MVAPETIPRVTPSLGPHTCLNYDTYLDTRESGILWTSSRKDYNESLYHYLIRPYKDGIYSRSTWAQQQGSGRLVAQKIRNPISTSLRLVIDPWHGGSVISALAFESGQWPHERKENQSNCLATGGNKQSRIS